jgi:hypothetical protein
MKQHQVTTEDSVPSIVSPQGIQEATARLICPEEGLSIQQQNLLRQVKRHARITKTCLSMYIVFSLLILLLFFSNWWVYTLWRYFLIRPEVLPLLSILSLLPGLLLTNSTARSKRALEHLKGVQDVRSIGFLIEGLSGKELHAGVRELLTKLLPRLQASDASLLNEQHHALLIQTLKRKARKRFFGWSVADTSFAVAVLKAWEQVGTGQALPLVEYLANHEADGQVRHAARECLPFLMARSKQEDNEQTLLRATTEPQGTAEELLRPASGQLETASEQLLRPHGDGQ